VQSSIIFKFSFLLFDSKQLLCVGFYAVGPTQAACIKQVSEAITMARITHAAPALSGYISAAETDAI
jgi:hypothetical protein